MLCSKLKLHDLCGSIRAKNDFHKGESSKEEEETMPMKKKAAKKKAAKKK